MNQPADNIIDTPSAGDRKAFRPSIIHGKKAAGGGDLQYPTRFADAHLARWSWALDMPSASLDPVLYRWESGYWRAIPALEIAREAQQWLRVGAPKNANARAADLCAATLINAAGSVVPRLPSLEGHASIVAAIGTRNHDLLLMEDGRLWALPHDPAHGLTMQVPIDLDPAHIDAEGLYTPRCGREVWEGTWFGHWLNTSTDSGEVAALLQEAVGSTLINRHLEKALVLSGEGANGKSTLIHLLAALHGEQATASIALSHLAGEFGLEALVGKSLLAIPDSEGFIPDIAVARIKSLVSGDLISANRKHLRAVSFLPRCALVIATNTPLLFRGEQHNYGTLRRFLTIPFDATIAPADRIPDLHRRILDQDSGLVLDWALAGAQRLAARGFRWPDEPAAVREIVREQRIRTDIVYAWVEEHHACANVRALTSRAAIYKAFRVWADADGRQALSAEAFWHRLRMLVSRNSPLEERRVLLDGRRERLVGLRVEGIQPAILVPEPGTPAPAPLMEKIDLMF